MPLSLTSVLFTLMQSLELTCNALRSASSTASCSLACCPWNSSSILFLQVGQTTFVMQQEPQRSQDRLGTGAEVEVSCGIIQDVSEASPLSYACSRSLQE